MEEGLKSVVKVGETIIEGMDMDVLAKMLRKASLKGGVIGAGAGSILTLITTKVIGKVKKNRASKIIEFPAVDTDETDEETTE